MDRRTLLLNMYQAMAEALGPSHWWPAETPFEVMVGAILTQNTAWVNVEKAIANLKAGGLLQPEKLYGLPLDRLAELIRPAGYYRLKAQRLKNFLVFLRQECRFDLEGLKKRDLDDLRDRLLAVKGIGPETADSILLYGLGLPTFVSDTYTWRILNRHHLAGEDAGYEEVRSLFMDLLPPDVDLYNELHALLVRVGNRWCKKKAGDCGTCPLSPFLP